MKKTIFKYPLQILNQQSIEVPIAAGMRTRVIYAGLDPRGVPCVWVEVPSDKTALERITIFVVGTGNPVPAAAAHHVGSFVQGPFVWHIYV